MLAVQTQQAFKQATYSYLATSVISKEEKQRLRKIFKDLDINGDGTLSLFELQEGYCKHMGNILQPGEIELLFEKADTNKDGSLSWEEFLVISVKRDGIVSQENLKKAFAVFDKDGSGKIDATEMQEIVA